MEEETEEEVEEMEEEVEEGRSGAKTHKWSDEEDTPRGD